MSWFQSGRFVAAVAELGSFGSIMRAAVPVMDRVFAVTFVRDREGIVVSAAHRVFDRDVFAAVDHDDVVVIGFFLRILTAGSEESRTSRQSQDGQLDVFCSFHIREIGHLAYLFCSPTAPCRRGILLRCVALCSGVLPRLEARHACGWSDTSDRTQGKPTLSSANKAMQRTEAIRALEWIRSSLGASVADLVVTC